MKKKKSALPERVKKYVKPDRDVHTTYGHYYLYECKSIYDPVKREQINSREIP